MGLVSTPHSKKASDPLLDLAIRKQQLKLKIQAQEAHITHSTKQLFTLNSIFKSVFNLVGNRTSIFEGFMIGFRVFRTIRSMFKK